VTPDAFSGLRRLLAHPRALAAWNPHGLRLHEAVLLELLERRVPAAPRTARTLLELFAEPGLWREQPPENLAFLTQCCEALRAQWSAQQQPEEPQDEDVDPLETLHGVFVRRTFAPETRMAMAPVRAATAPDPARLKAGLRGLFLMGMPRPGEREKVIAAATRGHPELDLARLANEGVFGLPESVYAEARKAVPDPLALVASLSLPELREVMREFLEQNELSTRPAARRVVDLLTGRFPASALTPRRVDALFRSSATLRYWHEAATTLARGSGVFEEELSGDASYEPARPPAAPQPLPAGSPGVRAALAELRRHDVLRPEESDLLSRWVARQELPPAEHERRDFAGLLATLPVGRRLQSALVASGRDGIDLAEARALWKRVLDHHGFDTADSELRRVASRARDRFGGLGEHAVVLVSKRADGDVAVHPYVGPDLDAACLHAALNRAGDLVVLTFATRDGARLALDDDPLLVRLRAPADDVYLVEIYRFVPQGPRGRFDLFVRSELHARP